MLDAFGYTISGAARLLGWGGQRVRRAKWVAHSGALFCLEWERLPGGLGNFRFGLRLA